MVKLTDGLRANAFIDAWHGPDKHRVRFALTAGLLSFALMLCATTSVWAKEAVLELLPEVAVASAATPLTPEQAQLLALTHAAQAPGASDADQARLFNATLPFSAEPILPARPLSLARSVDRERAVECLSQAIYYEAGFEPLEGRRAVAQVVLNRVRHPAFPKTVCGVVYEGAPSSGCQFSFACDGSLHRPRASQAWSEARQIAASALSGYVMKSVGEATHYHTDYVAPYWAPKLTKVKRIGAHIFYRWPGGWGEPGAFSGRYVGNERLYGQDPAQAVDAPEAPVLIVADAAKAPTRPAEPTDRRADGDVGVRPETDKSLPLNIALPADSKSGLSAMTGNRGDAIGG